MSWLRTAGVSSRSSARCITTGSSKLTSAYSSVDRTSGDAVASMTRTMRSKSAWSPKRVEDRTAGSTSDGGRRPGSVEIAVHHGPEPRDCIGDRDRSMASARSTRALVRSTSAASPGRGSAPTRSRYGCASARTHACHAGRSARATISSPMYWNGPPRRLHHAVGGERPEAPDQTRDTRARSAAPRS